MADFTRRLINAPDAPQTLHRRYSNALEVSGSARTLYISGQIPMDFDGVVPEDFESQARLAWGNVEKQLIAADMTLGDLVKVTVFLASYELRETNAKVRWEVPIRTISRGSFMLPPLRWLMASPCRSISAPSPSKWTSPRRACRPAGSSALLRDEIGSAAMELTVGHVDRRDERCQGVTFRVC